MACGGHDDNELRILILGKTGNGKSTLGNVLLGSEGPSGFAVARGLSSGTQKCQWDKAVHFGTYIEVTDTPGLCDTYLTNEEVYKELAKSVCVTEPGPHIILLALRCDRRFTEEEYTAYLTIKQMFSDDVDSFLILIFNGLDDCGRRYPIEKQRRTLDEDVRKCGDPLDEVMKNAQNRYFGMNNTVDEDQIETQAEELINFMKDLKRRNRGRYFHTEVTDQITERVEDMIRQEAADKHLSLIQATYITKLKIIQENMPDSFWRFVITLIISVCAIAIASMCSVM